MANPTIVIHDIETNEVVEREMTNPEKAAITAAQSAAEANLQAEATKAAEKSAVLAKLGLTAEEVAALLS